MMNTERIWGKVAALCALGFLTACAVGSDAPDEASPVASPSPPRAEATESPEVTRGRFLEDPFQVFGRVRVVAEDDEYFYIGGLFDSVGFHPRPVLVMDLTTGGVSEPDSAPESEPEGERDGDLQRDVEAFLEEHREEAGFGAVSAVRVTSMLQDEDQLFVAAESHVTRVVALGLDGGELSLQWSEFCDGGYDLAYHCEVNGLAAGEEYIYVGGRFVGFHDGPSNFAVLSRQDGSLQREKSGAFVADRGIDSLSVQGDQLFITGEGLVIDGLTQRNLVAISKNDGSLRRGWDPGFCPPTKTGPSNEVTSIHFDDEVVIAGGGRVVVYEGVQMRPCNDYDTDESGEESPYKQWYGPVPLSRESADIDMEYDTAMEHPVRQPSPPGSHPRFTHSTFDEVGLLTVQPMDSGHFAVAHYSPEGELVDRWEYAGPAQVRGIVAGPDAFFVMAAESSGERGLSFLRGYSREDGERLWEWSPESRLGYGAVDGDRLYISGEGELYVLSTQTGELLERFALEPTVVRGGRAPVVDFVQPLGEYLYISGTFESFDGEATGNLVRIPRAGDVSP